jgi:hypothetical protein
MGGQLARKKFFQFPRTHVARPYQQQLPGSVVQKDDHVLVGDGQLIDNLIGSFILGRQSGRVQEVVSRGWRRAHRLGGRCASTRNSMPARGVGSSTGATA